MGGRAMSAPVTRAQAERVRDLVAEKLAVDPAEMFLADHTHEGLSPGSWSLAFEGMYEWPFLITEDVHTHPGKYGPVFLEVGAGWRLHIYPDW